VRATVFLGGGRITSALVAGLRLAGYEHPIVVHDRHSRKLQELKRQHRIIVKEDLAGAIELADLLIVAVRPDSVRKLLKEIREQQLPRRLTAVSLAAGIPLSRLQARLGLPVRWARAMPSPVCRSGRGLTGLTFGRGLSASERAMVRNLFASVGAVVEIPEKHFDAFNGHLFKQSWLSRAGNAGGCSGVCWLRSQNRAGSRRARVSRRHCRLALGQSVPRETVERGSYSWRHCGGGDGSP